MRRRLTLLVVQTVKRVRRLEHNHECNQNIRRRLIATLNRLPPARQLRVAPPDRHAE
jgi:hypothetical protein